MLLFAFLLVGILGIIFSVWLASANEEFFSFVSGFIGFVGMAGFVVIGLMNCHDYGTYNDAKAELVTIKTKQSIQLKRTESVLASFSQEVAKYVKHEGDTYEKMTPEKASVVLTVYPQLQSIQSVTKLLEQISILNEGYYALQSHEQDLITTLVALRSSAFVVFPVHTPVIDSIQVN